MLKFLRIFEITLYSSALLQFITESAFYDLTAIIRLQNILIHFIRTTISRDILYILTITKVRSHIIEDVIAILHSCSNQLKQNAVFFLETWKKAMQRTLYSAKSTRTLKSIKTIKFYDDEYEFLNVQQWRIIFQFLINSRFLIFSIFMKSWMSCHSLLRYIFLSTWHYLIHVKAFTHIKLNLSFS